MAESVPDATGFSGKEVTEAWRDAIGESPADRPVRLDADGNVVDVETGEIVGELLLKRLAREAGPC